MKSLPLVFVIFIVLTHVHQWVLGAPERSCRAALQDITKLQMSLMAQCTKSMKFKSGKDKSKKLNCILRCAMIRAELTNPEGQVTPESIDFLLEKYIPESLIPSANETFYPCMEIGIKNPFKTPEEDAFCLTYDPFVKCFLAKASSFCK